MLEPAHWSLKRVKTLVIVIVQRRSSSPVYLYSFCSLLLVQLENELNEKWRIFIFASLDEILQLQLPMSRSNYFSRRSSRQ